MISEAPTFLTDETSFSKSKPQILSFAWERTSATDTSRQDGREPLQHREIAIEKSILSRADGSVSYKCGNTHVIASVNGPLSIDTNKEKLDSSTLEVNMKFRHSIGSQTSNDEFNMAMTIRESVGSVLALNLFPRSRIIITVQVIRDDGSLLASSINAAMLACLDAGLPCSGAITATTVVVAAETTQTAPKDDKMDDSHEQQSKKARVQPKEKKPLVLLVDPTLTEETSSQAKSTLAYTNISKVVSADKLGMKVGADSSDENQPIVSTPELVTNITFGVWDINDFLSTLQVAKQNCTTIYATFRDTFMPSE